MNSVHAIQNDMEKIHDQLTIIVVIDPEEILEGKTNSLGLKKKQLTSYRFGVENDCPQKNK